MMSGYQRSVRNARREFNAELLRGEAVTPQQIADRYIIANKAKWEAMKNMSLDLTAGQILGVSPRELVDVLGRISKKDAVALMYNKFIPFTISENVKEVFQQNADKLGVFNPYKEAEQAVSGLQRMMDEITLDMETFPDLTQIYDFNPTLEPEKDLQPTPSGAASINPQVYNRPSLTLSPITGLTRSQTALLSPADQQYYMKKNQTRIT